MRIKIALSIAAALVAATPAFAVVTNVLTNGSFEAAGTTGTGAFTGWLKSGTVGDSSPASVIAYSALPPTGPSQGGADYPNGAYGEAVTADNAVSTSPDAVGGFGAYFVGDLSNNEAIYQDVYLTPGNYRVGFSYYLPLNGLNNANNSSLQAAILGIPLATTVINSSSTGLTWFYATGIGTIQYAGTYRTSLVYNSNGNPAKDVVVDRVFGIATTDGPGILIPAAPDSIIPPPAVPEPATWAMLVAGFGLVGFGLRRRRPTVVAA